MERSDKRLGLPFTIAAGPHQQSFLGPSPVGEPGSRIYITQEQGGPVIPPPQALGSLSVTSYDSQGYGGGI
jgi:hypothetical protein